MASTHQAKLLISLYYVNYFLKCFIDFLKPDLEGKVILHYALMNAND